jgi:thiol-disulfide isomerase/thioredoxin
MKSMMTILSLLFFSISAFASDPVTLAIGAKAPDFTLPGTDAKSYSLKDFDAHKILAIVFTCNHCPTAQAYEDRIKQLVIDYKSKGVGVIAISPNDPLAIRLDELGYTDLSDTFDEMKIRARNKEYNFPYLYDGETSAVSMTYGPQATPHIFIFDDQRLLRYTGRIDDGEKPGTAKTNDARNALDAMLVGKPVPVEKTKTFGCSIKWPDKRDYANKAGEEWAKEKISIEELDLTQLKTLLKNDGVNYKLINVWATWCGPCITEFPEFVTMNRMYRNREFELITISLDEINRKPNALNFLTKKQASMKNYIFKGDKYSFIEGLDKKWEGSLPYTLFVAPGGKIIYGKPGLIDPLEVKKIIVENIGRIY